MQAATRVGSALASLLWTRALLHTMGSELWGEFVTFTGIAALGGLGDIGMGGAVYLSTSQYLARKDEEGVNRFLATARGSFLLAASAFLVIGLALSPILPVLFHFAQLSNTGSLPILFMMGAVTTAVAIIGSYFANLNYAVLNLTWAILPLFAISQASTGLHWLLAKLHYSLTIQYSPYVFGAVANLLVCWACVRISEPRIARLTPVRMDLAEARKLMSRSGWIYLISISTYIYFTTDRILINAVLGPNAVPAYQLNYKYCEVALMAILSASAAGMPKITQWLSSPESETRTRGISELQRLNRFVCFLGCAGAVTYLAVNDLFVIGWFGASYKVSLLLQSMFAANLAVTVGSSVALDAVVRIDEESIRFASVTALCTAFLNAAVSAISVLLFHSSTGVAFATVLAQGVQTIFTSRYISRRLDLSFPRWVCLAVTGPLLVVGGAFAVRTYLFQTAGSAAFAYAVLGIIILAAAAAYGINRTMIIDEMRILRGIQR